MSRSRHLMRQFWSLKYFALPVLGVAAETYFWKQEEIQRRITVCATLAAAFGVAYIAWKLQRAKAARRHRHHHHHSHHHRHPHMHR